MRQEHDVSLFQELTDHDSVSGQTSYFAKAVSSTSGSRHASPEVCKYATDVKVKFTFLPYDEPDQACPKGLAQSE